MSVKPGAARCDGRLEHFPFKGTVCTVAQGHLHLSPDDVTSSPTAFTVAASTPPSRALSRTPCSPPKDSTRPPATLRPSCSSPGNRAEPSAWPWGNPTSLRAGSLARFGRPCPALPGCLLT